jgi:hypothetical protein
MFLWTRKNSAKKHLATLKDFYLGKNNKEFLKKLKEMRFPDNNFHLLAKKNTRDRYFRKYPELSFFNKLLFRTLFAETIYNKDIRLMVNQICHNNKFLALKKKLEKDAKAISILSTHAVNYFYNLSYFLKDESIINPEIFYAIAKKYYNKKTKNGRAFQIYLLTHCIIGESHFYSRKIMRNREIYFKMIKLLEKIILDNFFSISLDNKIEFLVCTKLCRYSSPLEKLILDESARSLSDMGNFIIDTRNDRHSFITRNIQDSEHRNVLFIMANEDFCIY